MKLAVIGDIHSFWDDRDTAYFNRSDYDGLLFVGDLPRLTGSRSVTQMLSELDKPAWLIPGNHDGVTAPQLLAELKGWRWLARLGALGMRRRMRRLRRHLGPVRLCGFEMITLAEDLGLLVARPHAMGPDRFYYRAFLRKRYGINDFRGSAATLKSLVDLAPRRLIVLAHNGPAGLGDQPDAPWGCDFSPAHGDFGDPDLREAIDHAGASGRQVLAVAAGHMHLTHKTTGARRQAWARQDGILYVNAAAVPRIREDGARRRHVALEIGDGAAEAAFVDVDESGNHVAETPLR